LAPGQRIKPAEIRDRFDVSVGVVREALTRLAEQHLVRSELNKGFQVVSISADELRQLTDARKVNEGAALRMSIERGDVSWEGEVLAAHHRLVRTPIYPYNDPDHTNEGFSAAHDQFHFILMAACGNEYLLDVCRRLFDAAELYRRWSTSGGKTRDAKAEHKAIMEAALARKSDDAVALYQKHIDRTAEVILIRLSGD
ncbi:MAG TPA: GntR family transcriptional regulator, partial [Ilumatobacteraceae bacterium]